MRVLRFFHIIQLLSIASSAYLTWYLMLRNGTVCHLKKTWDSQCLPGTEVPLTQSFTGFGPFDRQLKLYNGIIWVVVSGASPDISLHAYLFAGQLAAAYGLLILEGARNGNRGRIISL